MSRWDAESPFSAEDAATMEERPAGQRSTGSASPSSEGRSEISHDSPLDAAAAAGSLYVTHKLTKLDTLAGLAVKYGVTVGDIKRLNGLLSDSAMFARSTLLIPTKQLPVGEDVAMWVGMIVSGMNRHGSMPPPGSRRKGNQNHLTMMGFKPPASEALSKLNDFYGLADAAAARSAAEAAQRAASARQAAAENGDVEVELMNVSAFAGGRDGPKADDRLRRRNRADGEDGEEFLPLVGDEPPSHGRTFSAALVPPSPARVASSMSKKESFFDKLRRAASQPVLAGPPRAQSSISSAADAIITGEGGSRLGSGSGRQGMAPMVKAGGKKD